MYQDLVAYGGFTNRLLQDPNRRNPLAADASITRDSRQALGIRRRVCPNVKMSKVGSPQGSRQADSDTSNQNVSKLNSADDAREVNPAHLGKPKFTRGIFAVKTFDIQDMVVGFAFAPIRGCAT